MILLCLLQNSIRHNLSLHNRFIRIQNEGNGKSSWWMVDADAKTEKTKRRSRSSSLDSDSGPKATKTKRPGRKGKRCDLGDDKPLSPNSKLRVTPKSPISTEPSVILEDNSFPFPPSDYRNRSSSNASNVSSISGRLSPIPSHDEDNDIEQEMSYSPPQDKPTPVVVDELMDSMKENLNMSIPCPQPTAQGDISAYMAQRFNDDSMNIDNVQPAAQQFVDSRYPSASMDYFPATNLKHVRYNTSKIPPPKTQYNDELIGNTLQQHLNSLYNNNHANVNSGNSFQTIPEQRSVSQVMIPHERAPPPPYGLNNSMHRPQLIHNRPPQHSSRYQPYYQNATPDIVPMISVEMADSALPGDFDIEFLERLDRDITCDVESVLRNDSAFNDGHLDFNLDNYVSAISLPEISVSNHISGSMVH